MPEQVIVSENSRKLYVADLANDVHCNFPPEALMNTVSSYVAAYIHSDNDGTNIVISTGINIGQEGFRPRP